MAESLIIGEQIELIGAGTGPVASVNPLCTGATFWLQPGYDLSAPQPVTDITASLLLDGDRPFGYAAGNRTITLPIEIAAPDFPTLAAAREVLLREINEQTWTLRWTRDTTNPLPLLFDCFRAHAAVWQWGGIDSLDRFPIGLMTISFEALPYGRSDVPVVVDFPAALAGKSAPPAAVVIDAYTSVSGTNWTTSTVGPTGNSAYWSPPGGNPTGAGISAALTVTGLSLNITGLPALTVHAGFGSSAYYPHWARLGGRVTFAFTLTDNASHVLKFSRTVKVTGSNLVQGPVFTKVRVPVPSSAVFSFANLTGYTVTVTNRGTNDLQYTVCYLAGLTAVPPPSAVATPAQGVVYDLAGIVGTARAPVSLQLQQAGTQAVTKTIRLSGAGSWLCPVGCTTVSVYAVGGGGAGSQCTSVFGGGGGSGGSAFNAAVAVTASNSYAYTVGPGGYFNGTTPVNGGDTTFTGDSITVTAHHGNTAPNNSATAGTAGAAGTGGFAGAAGGAGSSPGGGGGGSSGGSAAGGNVGATGAAGGAGGAAVAGGGKGGSGAKSGFSPGPGAQPGAGGGGGYSGTHFYGSGASGELILIYNQVTPQQSLIVHRPPVTAPPFLSPFVSPSTGDLPDGTTEYPLVSLVPNVSAQFGGTYTVVAAPWSWHSPAVAKTLTITVKQYEQPGGASYSSSVALTFTPSTSLVQLTSPNAGTGFVIVGEMTLPVQDLPQDNLNAFYTVTVTDSDTADRYMDILFLDTRGSTVIVQSPTSYQNMYLDEPSVDRDIGLIMGSLFDRPDAVSVIDRAIVAGGPVTIDPDGNASLLAYAMEGAPNCEMIYHPRWWLDRYQ